MQRPETLWKTVWSLDDLALLMRGTFAEQLGIRFIEIGADWLSADLSVLPAQVQGVGLMQAGVALTLAEAVATLASQMAVEAETHSVCGLDIKANHCRLLSPVETIRATARPLYLGRQTHEWEVHIDARGGDRLVCVARLTTAIKTRAGEPVRAAA